MRIAEDEDQATDEVGVERADGRLERARIVDRGGTCLARDRRLPRSGGPRATGGIEIGHGIGCP
jgi:hypothetical protein